MTRTVTCLRPINQGTVLALPYVQYHTVSGKKDTDNNFDKFKHCCNYFVRKVAVIAADTETQCRNQKSARNDRRRPLRTLKDDSATDAQQLQ